MKKNVNRKGPKTQTPAAMKRDAPPARGANVSREARSFPIVGIGASAGGLEALEQFFKTVPVDCGMAFVVIQHLDPTRKALMAELLQKSTALPVTEAKDRMKVEPNHIYVIPPNYDLSILHGVLHLLEMTAPRGLHLPIDSFFRALAADQQENSIGVILSGMGSDGTLGLRAIKEKAGAVFVQAPDSAKFDSMPRSAIDAGLADVTASAEALPSKIIAYRQHTPVLNVPPSAQSRDNDLSGLEKVVLLLRTQTGHDFSLYKNSTIYRRIARRMGLHQLAKISDYVRFLRSNPHEGELLFKELLIGVTNFFRDPVVWEQLKTEIIPELISRYPGGGTLRAWTTACSTGEEAYSLAIVFREALDELKPTAQYALQVFATDLDKDAIEQARGGVYPANIAADVTEARLHRFFVQEERGYRVTKGIREMVIFAPQNLVMDPPFTKLDILTCRNLLIYLEAELQKKLLPLFHYSLNPNGVLLLGTSETIGQSGDLFTALPGKNRIYHRQETDRRPDLVDFPSSFSRRHSGIAGGGIPPAAAPPAANVEALTDTLLLQRFSPAAVLTTLQGDVVYSSAKTGTYLEPAVGKANLNLFAMAREGLSGPLNEAFARAVREKTTVILKAVKIGTNGGSKVVDITVQAMTDPAPLRGMVLIVFQDVVVPTVTKRTSKAKSSALATVQLDQLALELRRSREELQSNREEMQTSQEELKSTNEELQSTNEELQSTNEELTTSKEEMQSMNEELQTVNHELNAKVDELSLASDDMKNLLNSTNIATLFLDDQLKVRRFTTRTTSIIKLIPGDAGRPVTDIVTTLDYLELADDASEVLRSLVTCERQVSTSDGLWFEVRIMPYRTQDNRIDGVVITFVDVSESKTVEATLLETLAVLQSRFTDQTAELDAANVLEDVLQKAQAVLEKRLTAQGSELRQSRADLATEKGRDK